VLLFFTSGGALAAAAIPGNKNMIELLVEKDADMNANHSNGRTSRQFSCNGPMLVLSL